MKRSIAAALGAVALMAGSLMMVAPASALQVSVPNQCTAYAYYPAYGASSAKGTCALVRSMAKVRNSAGSLVTITGDWGVSSSALGNTTMVYNRWINIAYSRDNTGWIGY